MIGRSKASSLVGRDDLLRFVLAPDPEKVIEDFG
jgi:hypothetical protein